MIEMAPVSGSGRQTGVNRLSAVFVKQTREPGVYLDGGGLRFQVTKAGGRRWFMRVVVGGKSQDIALGTADIVSLAEVREKAAVIRKAVAEGRDPKLTLAALVVAQSPEQAKPAAQSGAVTFRDAWLAFWELKAPQLKSERVRRLWKSQMERLVLPFIGDRPVADIRPPEIIKTLQPIWNDKEFTGRKVLQRVSAVFTSAITREWRERANPCEGVSKELGQRRQKARHFAALPWVDVPDFLDELRGRHGMAASRECLEFVILTAVRSGEARGAVWSEFDLEQKLWTIPATRMKTGAVHRVPISTQALTILIKMRELHPCSHLVFPGTKGQPLSDMTLLKRLRDMGLEGKATVHGFRSTFKDWCAVHGVRDEVSEGALAHADRNAVRAAYRRTDYLDERRELMSGWADFCCGTLDGTSQKHASLSLRPDEKTAP